MRASLLIASLLLVATLPSASAGLIEDACRLTRCNDTPVDDLPCTPAICTARDDAYARLADADEWIEDRDLCVTHLPRDCRVNFHGACLSLDVTTCVGEVLEECADLEACYAYARAVAQQIVCMDLVGDDVYVGFYQGTDCVAIHEADVDDLLQGNLP